MVKATQIKSEGGRISFNQALAMVIIMSLATTNILVPTVIASLSGRDSWITVLFSTMLAILIVTFSFYLATRMGGRNIIQYSITELGRWAGGLVAFFYTSFFILQSAMTVRNFRTIMLTAFYKETPDIIFKFFTMVVIMYAVANGLELVGRLNEILLPLRVAILALVGAMAAGDVDLSEFTPVLADGPEPVLSGSLRLVVYAAQGALVFLMLYPLINKKGSNYLKLSLAVASLGPMLMVGAMFIGIFGVWESSNNRFVALELVRNINIADFAQNLDALIMAIWYSSVVAKLAILVYLSCLSLSQWFNLETYRPLLPPLLVLLIALSKIVYIGPEDMIYNITQVEPGWNLTALLFIPLFLLLFIFIRRRGAPDA